jgi:hypothetical protein
VAATADLSSGFSVPVARRIVVTAREESAGLKRAGCELPVVPARIFRRGLAFVRRVATAVERTAEREEFRDEVRAGVERTENADARPDPLRQDALRKDIMPPLPGAPKTNPLVVRICPFSIDFQ